ncbi:putative FtsX-related transmembrane transport protein [Indibacter alkaliphilus LW1]|uniref:FtsX-related transmembrane transport protein n=1 Tax=Indibacter alkaliphilus (strain CCUG 57479 / KCTC 22604 / LW1) TaxID=1189612 RepID=S2DIB4_INDAL|nr:FtsX-like permease family protein [Indibacter alkaliphilus]EOZ98764.1 putative FtsX-related transmembrane transport protein [Indibacter alkaliphilus LW1]
MLKNYIKIALRNLKKRKAFSIINILSLALGLTGGIFMLVYALDEFSYDNFHENGDRIYRVNTVFVDAKSGNESYNSTNGWPVGKILESDFPEVENVIYTITWPKLDIKTEEETLSPRMAYVTESFFDVFSFEQMKGSPSAALSQPYQAVITESMESLIFKGQDGLGKEFFLADSIAVKVGAVVKDAPENSHIQFEVLLSQSTFERLIGMEDYMAGWGNINMTNYLMLREGTDAEAFKDKAKSVYMDHVGDMMRSWGAEAFLKFEPMKDIYLRSEAGNPLGTLGSIDRVYMVLGICLFTILLACINFINLSTARSVDRFKEVGLRKVVGSTRMALITQFMTEAFVLTLFGLLIAVFLASMMMPVFNELVNKTYQLNSLLKPEIILGILALLILISLFAGYYPSLHLSGLQPVKILKGKFNPGGTGPNLRKALVVFQFFISVSLALGTLVVLNQLDFMQQKELGFAKDEILVINASKLEKSRIESLKYELGNISGIQSVTYSNGIPGRPGWIGQIAYPDGREAENPVSVEYLAVDEDYLSTLNLDLVAGRFFDPERETDRTEGLVLNERAVRQFGWDSPEEALGQKIVSPSTTPQGTVIGVVRDYHQLGLQQSIHGIAMDWAPDYSYWLSLRFEPSQTTAILETLNQKWINDFTGMDFKYFFLNEDFERLYQAELRMAKMFRLFAGLTLLISLIGLLGLVSFMIESRSKEMSIRKVLGAGVHQIVYTLSREFMLLVMIASVLAAPVAWYFGKEWLQNFAYRTPIALGNFLTVILMALLVTLSVVGFQALKAAYRNTVNGLRSE